MTAVFCEEGSSLQSGRHVFVFIFDVWYFASPRLPEESSFSILMFLDTFSCILSRVLYESVNRYWLMCLCCRCHHWSHCSTWSSNSWLCCFYFYSTSIPPPFQSYTGIEIHTHVFVISVRLQKPWEQDCLKSLRHSKWMLLPFCHFLPV